MLHLIPYKTGSSGIRAIKEYFLDTGYGDFKVIKPQNFSYGNYLQEYSSMNKKQLCVCWGNVSHVSANWGQAFQQDGNRNVLLNSGANVATDKLAFFKAFKNNPNVNQYFPPWTDKTETAQQWSEQGKIVLCRTKLSAHSGDGIFIANSPAELVPAKLYTQYIKKKDEYRVHINKFRETYVWQQKRLKTEYDADNPNLHKIRNHHNGWVYCRSNVYPPQVVLNAAKALRNSVNFPLDFAAVDIIYNQAQNKAYILEANSAPGLCGDTVKEYAELFRDWAEAVKNA